MAKLHKLWRIFPPQDELCEQLSTSLGIPKVVAQVLLNRGITNKQDALTFLYGGAEVLGDPLQMKHVGRAVLRINEAIRRQEKITVYGDYDVDGITASSLMLKVLARLKAKVEYYIPERQSEGYGLNAAALEHLYNSGTKLLITVDCGISSAAEVAAMTGKMDIIITDHHQPPAVLPPAYAVINPKQTDCGYADKQLAGVGVAFKLCQALWQSCAQPPEQLLAYLDIVALGTIADIVPLVGENRILVKLGLERLAATDNIGLKALIKVCGLNNSNIDAEKVGFSLAPRLNAAGRIGHAAAGVELLLTEDDSKAAELASYLDRENAERQAVEREILASALESLEQVDMEQQKVLVVAGHDWHPGVIGIVASRLVEKFYKPVIMISIRDGIGKGSCRSIAAFDIHQALGECADLLIQFGGHHQAAGLTIKAENIEHLQNRLNEIAGKKLTPEDYTPVINVDSLLALEEINAALLEQLACLAPHGMGNPGPVFACENLALADMRTVGTEGRHLKLRVKKQNISGDVIAWGMGALQESLSREQGIDVAFIPEFNEWQGRRSIQLRAYDIKQTVRTLSPVDKLYTQGQDESRYKNIAAADRFCTKLAGVTFDDRQQVIQTLTVDERLLLRREPDNPYDSNAICVETKDGRAVGYLNAALAKELAKVIDEGRVYRCVVSMITGGADRHYGVNVVIYREQQHLCRQRPQIAAGCEEDLVRSVLLGGRAYHTSQRDVLASLAQGKNTLAIMGTGRGKSAIFQTHAALEALRHNKMSIILYPLRALVNDQYNSLVRRTQSLGLKVFKGNGVMTADERVQLFDAIGNHEVDILLTTPEFIEANLARFTEHRDNIAFFVVDECHHIHLSGKRQRPVYQRMDTLLEALGNPLVLAVTATANDETAATICKILGIENIIVDPTIRSNLRLEDARNTQDKIKYLKRLIAQDEKVLIYVNSRKQAFELASKLRELYAEKREQIGFYHAGLSNEWRVQVEEWFRAGYLKTVVATSAFGEGIDLPDIRHVVLYHMTFNMTAFNQQCGRAGRDGQLSFIHLLFGQQDRELNHLILSNTAPERTVVGQIYLILKDAAVKQEIMLSNADIAVRAKEKFRLFIDEHGISTALKILEEMSLLWRETSGPKRIIHMLPAPSYKLDLEQSITYREGLLEKEAFQHFADDVMSLTGEELLRWINRPVVPTKLGQEAIYGL